VVTFLCIVSFVYDEAFDALYIILLALFHDLTIVTIAYDHQTASAKPETPTVMMLIVVAYTMGLTLSASSTILYALGHKFLSPAFAAFKYKESCMFLQISNSSALLIFNARTTGFFFSTVPAKELAFSAVVSQAFLNTLLLFSDGFIVEQLHWHDIAMIWAYDVVWMFILDFVKMAIIRIQDGPEDQMTLDQTMAKATATRNTTGSRNSKMRVSKNLRVSLGGMPMPAKV